MFGKTCLFLFLSLLAACVAAKNEEQATETICPTCSTLCRSLEHSLFPAMPCHPQSVPE